MSRRGRRGRATVAGRAAAGPDDAVRSRWTPRETLIAALATTFLVVQLAVPAALLLRPRPQRFGWQMFSSAPGTPTVVGRWADGTRQTLDLYAYFAFLRGDIAPSYTELLPAHICRVTPGLVAVELYRAPGAPVEVRAC